MAETAEFIEKEVKRDFYDRESGFQNVANTMKQLPHIKNRKLLREIVESLEAFQIGKKSLKRTDQKNMRIIWATHNDYGWQVDLVGISRHSRKNKGYKYILIVQDTQSFSHCSKTS